MLLCTASPPPIAVEPASGAVAASETRQLRAVTLPPPSCTGTQSTRTMAIARATAAVARAPARPPQLALARAAAVPKPQQFHTSAAPQGGHHLMFEPS